MKRLQDAGARLRASGLIERRDLTHEDTKSARLRKVAIIASVVVVTAIGGLGVGAVVTVANSDGSTATTEVALRADYGLTANQVQAIAESYGEPKPVIRLASSIDVGHVSQVIGQRVEPGPEEQGGGFLYVTQSEGNFVKDGRQSRYLLVVTAPYINNPTPAPVVVQQLDEPVDLSAITAEPITLPQ